MNSRRLSLDTDQHDDGGNLATVERPLPVSTTALVDGRYRIERELGRGGMGIVYLAHDMGLQRRVALKIIPPDRVVDPEVVAQFQREAQTLATIRTPHVVAVHAFGRFEETYFFAMEYVPGPSLESFIDEHAGRNERVPIQRALDILHDLAAGLTAVHRAGIVHRDVKPANVILAEGIGRPVLVDFGLADTHHQHGVVGGTPSYCPVEQLTGAPSSPAFDVYALAVLAFELLTGTLPFVARTVTELVRLHAKVEAPLLSSALPELQPLDHILARALDKAPARRYAGADRFSEELRSAGASLTRPARASPRVAPGEVERVFVIDPVQATRSSIRRATETALFWHPAEVEGFRACADAKRPAADRPPDLLILGPEVPSADAIALLAHLRAEPNGDAVRAIVVTGDEELRTSRVRFAALGVRDFVGKTIDAHALCDAIKVACRSTPASGV